MNENKANNTVASISPKLRNTDVQLESSTSIYALKFGIKIRISIGHQASLRKLMTVSLKSIQLLLNKSLISILLLIYRLPIKCGIKCRQTRVLGPLLMTLLFQHVV
jgi:hypothetical protein